MKLIKKILLSQILIFILSTTLIYAGEADTTGNADTNKTESDITFTKLGEHTFSVISFIENPFIVHSLRVNVGVAKTIAKKYTIPLEEIGMDTIYAKSEMTYLMGGIGYKHKINDWAAISIDASVMGRVSSTLATIIFRGISTISGFALKWHIKTLETKRSLLTSSLSLNNYNYYYISIYKFYEEIIDTNTGKPPSFDSEYSTLGTVFGLSYAFGCTDFFGFLVTAHLGYGEIPSNDFHNGFFWDAEFYLDFNFSHLINVPIALSIGSEVDTYPFEIDNPTDFSRSSFLKIAYVGNKYINLGLETGYVVIPEFPRNNSEVKVTSTEDEEKITNKIFSTHFVLKLFF